VADEARDLKGTPGSKGGDGRALAWKVVSFVNGAISVLPRLLSIDGPLDGAGLPEAAGAPIARLLALLGTVLGQLGQ
jgi:hypothetical protein